ncbi:MAG: hypothetical protein ABSE82_12420, partial [Nitrososphaerales archaeon]
QGTAPATWSGRVATTSTFYPDHTSVVSIGTTVYFAGANATSVATWSLAFGSATVPKAYAIDATVSGTAAPVSISEYGTGNALGTGNKLAVLYGTTTTIYFSNSSTDTSWSAKQTMTTSETSLLGITTLINGTQVGGIWSSAAASPFTIRFGQLNTQSFNPTLISPSTVDTSTTKTATSTSSENKLFYDLGLWWDFFSIGTGIDYATSSDGLVWSAPTSVITSATYTGAEYGSDFALDISGNTVYWALSSGGASGGNTANYDYNSGTLASAGTIAFGTTGTVPTAFASQGPISISVDVSGNAWVALTTLNGATYHIEVYEHASGAANTVWSTNIVPSTLPALSTTANSAIEGLQTVAGAALVTEVSGTAGTGLVDIYSTTVTSGWTTGTWTTAVSPPSDYALTSSSETLVGSTLAFEGLAASSISQTTGTLNYWTFIIGGSATSIEQTIEGSTAAWQSSISSEGTTIFLFDASVSTINYYYTSNLGYTWSSKTVATTYEPSITGLSGSESGTMAVTWTSGNPSYTTFTIRFASLSSLTVSNNGGYTVDLVSLFFSNPTTNVLVTYYVSNSTNLFGYWINPGASVSIALTFIWTTSTAYEITIGTSTGVVVAVAATSPA